MESLVTVLSGTPIPTILVVSGIVFLFLALAGQIAGRLELPPASQKWSAVASIVLLSSGLLLYIAPAISQGPPEQSTGAPIFVEPASPTQVGLPPAAAAGSAAPVLSGAQANVIPEDAENCFAEIFSGIATDRIEQVEIGKVSEEVIGAHQTKKDPAGIIVTELGQPAAALTFLLIEDDALFKIGSVVDASCQPLEFTNASRGGARDALQNYDTLEVITGSGKYSLRFSYGEGSVSLDTFKIEQ